MQILITTSALSRPKVLQFTPWSLVLTGLALIIPLMILSLFLYHAVVLKAAHERWPIISEAVRLVERPGDGRHIRHHRAAVQRRGDGPDSAT